MISRIHTFAVAAIAAITLPALADELSDCTKSRASSRSIKACTNLIETGSAPAQDKAVALFYRGRHYQSTGRHEQAIEDFDWALSLAPNTAVILISRGISNHKLGELDDAIHDYDLAIAADPDQAYAYYGRGNTLVEVEDFELAARDYDRAVKLEPKFGDADNKRADARCALNRGARSHASRLRAIELGAVRVATLQQLLVRLGILYSGVTGTLDADTRTALQDWAMTGCPRR